MTAFAINSGSTEYYDQKASASTNATLDTWTISVSSTLVVRTDTYACLNHSVAAGSLDNVAWSGVGGTLQFDPTYTRQISYTGGSGNAPAYGTTISQGGVSGVFLGTWADWQSEPTVPGNAIPASGYMKLGGITGGAFSAGALTGITADCSGADIQSWIEIRGAETATITIPRLGQWIGPASTVWFEIGTTNGSAGQVIQCPTTATVAGVFSGVWVETSAGSGVYEHFVGVGSQVAISTTRTDSSCKFIWQTTSGIRFGNNGTNNVGYVPATGCKVRIPAVILTNCTRSAGGSGARVVPHATASTRQKTNTTSGGYIDIKGFSCQWYLTAATAYFLQIEDCTFATVFECNTVSSAISLKNIICTPAQAQLSAGLTVTNQASGGTILNCSIWRFSATFSAATAVALNNSSGITITGCKSGLTTERTANIGCAIVATNCTSTTVTNHTCLGGIIYFTNGGGDNTVTTPTYYDGLITTTTTSTTQTSAVQFISQSGINTLDGFVLPNSNYGPYTSLAGSTASSGVRVRNIGTYASPITLNSSVTGSIYASGGANSDAQIARCYTANTRLGPYATASSDSNVVYQDVYGDFADTSAVTSSNTTVKGCGLTGTTTGQTSVYGSHFQGRFTSTTAGFMEITCHEPTTASAAQCYITSGTPKFNSAGQILMVTSGQQIVWEMNFYAIGYTAFTNTLPTITGTNVASAGSGVWGNHLLEFQINTGSGYGGTWLTLTAANLTAQTITPTDGFKLKIRATCQSSSSTNALTNIRVAMTTTSADQSTNLYPLQSVNFSVTNMIAGSRVQIYNTTQSLELLNEVVAGTSYTLEFTGDENDIVRTRVTSTTGATSYLPYEANAQAGTADFSLFVEQEADDVYNTYALDGSAITKFSADYGNDTTDLVLTSDYSAQEFYAWWIYNLTTEQGIREFYGGVTAVDEANIRINATVLDMYLDNETTTNIVQSDNRRFYRDDFVYPVKRPTTGGGGVDVVWRNTILIATNDSATIAAAVHDYTVESGMSYDEMFKVQHSALTGKVSGANTTTERFRDIADTKDRIVYTVDANGNRTAVTQDGT